MTKNEIQKIRSLADKRGRAAEGLFLAEGAKLVGELTASELVVEQVLATEEGLAEFPGAERISPAEMGRISALKTPTAVAALVRIPERSLDVAACCRGLCLALDGVQDPGNLGTILRLADWFGIADVVCSPASADCFNPKVVQATMGAIARVRVHYTPLDAFLREAAREVPLYGTFLDGESIYTAELSPRGVIVMGSEGKGISPPVESLLTRRLNIPSYPPGAPTSESLNVAIATAVVCAEFRRR